QVELGRCRAPCFFFFQAEDGIRDFHVTGVQTCALPIWTASMTSSSCSMERRLKLLEPIREQTPSTVMIFVWSMVGWYSRTSTPRSEERRVGKGCRCRRAAA